MIRVIQSGVMTATVPLASKNRNAWHKTGMPVLPAPQVLSLRNESGKTLLNVSSVNHDSSNICVPGIVLQFLQSVASRREGL